MGGMVPCTVPPTLYLPMPVNHLSIRLFAGVCSFSLRLAHRATAHGPASFLPADAKNPMKQGVAR